MQRESWWGMKKIRMADVARDLHLSEATVSLAVNHKPGVSEKTRRRVLEYIGTMEGQYEENRKKDSPEPYTGKGIIEILIIVTTREAYSDQSDSILSTAVLSEYVRQVKERGYTPNISIVELDPDRFSSAVRECSSPEVKGVIVSASRLTAKYYEMLKKIQKPLVLYDYQSPDAAFSSVCIDNDEAVRLALDYCLAGKPKNIVYFRSDIDLLYFHEREEAFRKRTADAGYSGDRCEVVPVGNNLKSCSESICAYLKDHPLPDAVIMENYLISMGFLCTVYEQFSPDLLKKMRIAAIDALPEYLLGSGSIAQVVIPHVERVVLCMDILEREITGKCSLRMNTRVYPTIRLPETKQ